MPLQFERFMAELRPSYPVSTETPVDRQDLPAPKGGHEGRFCRIRRSSFIRMTSAIQHHRGKVVSISTTHSQKRSNRSP